MPGEGPGRASANGRAAFEAALGLLAAGIAAWWLPQMLELFSIINATVYTAMAVLALSLALVWGFGGILCFGQAAFFGLGGYAYAVAALNLPDTTYAVPIAILVPSLAAAALGYVMFFGRISDVYMGVITLTVTLILFNFVNSTAGEEWRIGAAPLGGFNGIPTTPPLNLPGDPGTPLAPEQIFVLAVLCLGLCYALCKLVLRSRFGRVVVAIRENELRAALLGYDVRLYKLGIFTIGGAMAGLAGLLFANCVFVSPTMFSLAYSGQIIIWVMVGGIGTLLGPVIGAMLLQALTAWVGTLPEINPNLILGLVLLVAVLAIPRGLQPTVAGWLRRRLPEDAA
ncbi:branched-chain amino acid ABC transporter permease [Roseicella frigidaeris]|uniref:Branched-chain amino acid ABC transporter permease n=1 Tax=Roseicella frigidaeris TaxID=2230885 RepID=A0A327MCR7_9PROT|nr:branched-chain amino acid ABC transporter permease [Roseicella frigidaeris]RAI60439.1 branched-chain amino acid ABC transporter permease [Roseicella frigidaeris]